MLLVLLGIAAIVGVVTGLAKRKSDQIQKSDYKPQASRSFTALQEPTGTREINIWHSNWKATGITVSVPQYALDVRAEVSTFTADGRQVVKVVEKTLKFPNVLAQLDSAAAREMMIEALIAALRAEAEA